MLDEVDDWLVLTLELVDDWEVEVLCEVEALVDD